MNADPQTWLYPLLYKSFVLFTADLYRLKLAGLVTKTAKAISENSPPKKKLLLISNRISK